MSKTTYVSHILPTLIHDVIANSKFNISKKRCLTGKKQQQKQRDTRAC
jgi:hypothetical protein